MKKNLIHSLQKAEIEGRERVSKVFRQYEQSVPLNCFQLLQGRLYGTNPSAIYKELCGVFGWDKSKINQFEENQPLYAKNVDGDGEVEVWFLSQPFYRRMPLEQLDHSVISGAIDYDGDYIFEYFNKFYHDSGYHRVTFIKTDKGYVFFGVYKLITFAGSIPVYKRIGYDFPMTKLWYQWRCH